MGVRSGVASPGARTAGRGEVLAPATVSAARAGPFGTLKPNQRVAHAVALWDVIVVGGGAAGLSAAIFTAQAGLSTLVLDSCESTMRHTAHIHNYLGFPRFVGGEELLRTGIEQVKRFDGVVRVARVEHARREEGGFVVRASGVEERASALVLATGFATSLADDLGLRTVQGLGGYFPERHVATDDACRAAPGVYAAGLARRWEYQAIVTAGDGARAAVTLLSDRLGRPYYEHE